MGQIAQLPHKNGVGKTASQQMGRLHDRMFRPFLLESALEIHSREDAIRFLESRLNYERAKSVPYNEERFKLDSMRQLLTRLGDPDRDFPIIHIAGTKGKGSTATMIASVLSASGRRTGLYTSPHLERLEERFRVDGKICSEQELIALVRAIQPAVEALEQEVAPVPDRWGPTYFEMVTAMAMLHFSRQGAEAAVLEVGLGGRLDSTNVCMPVVSVITSISFDHTQQLGNTLAEIAGEKGGIIKPGVPVVSGVVQEEPRRVIERIAQDRGCCISQLGVDFHVRYHPLKLDATMEKDSGSFRLQAEIDYAEGFDALHDEEHWTLPRLSLGLIGRHQAVNAAIALATLRQLQKGNGLSWEITEEAIREGLANAHQHCPARLEVISLSPTVVMDVAHNPASIAATVQVLRESFFSFASAGQDQEKQRDEPHKQPRLLMFAATQDKDFPAMLRLLLPHFNQVIFTRYRNNPRAVPPAELAKVAEEIFAELGKSAKQTITDDPATACAIAQSWMTPQHLVCVTGSFFLVSEVRAIWG